MRERTHTTTPERDTVGSAPLRRSQEALVEAGSCEDLSSEDQEELIENHSRLFNLFCRRICHLLGGISYDSYL